jgi:S-adenosylmethionine synthetase
MDIVFISRPRPPDPELELVERKGTGHPDTLADDMAEELSRAYSSYTLEKYGAILHHNFDKVGLLGGKSEVRFGYGRLISPIRVLINGRASDSFGDQPIPVRALLTRTARQFLINRLPSVDPDRDLEIHFNVSTGSSPGHVLTDTDSDGSRRRWFHPRSLLDLRERTRLASNDTSIGCAHYPLSQLEQCVLEVEGRLTSEAYRCKRPWLGTDIKVIACRVGADVSITMCVPQIANYVRDGSEYERNLSRTRGDIDAWFRQALPCHTVELHLNTKDNHRTPELYLTATGSSIESGDEGLVGRGNRPNGLISSTRLYSMEGSCGKNPVYHAGKLYPIAAQEIAMALFKVTGCKTEVCLISQGGREVADPWKVVVIQEGGAGDAAGSETIIRDTLTKLPLWTEQLVRGERRICF